jgi:triosephosphate isomerase
MDGVWIVANWKSHKKIAEALEWLSIVGPRLKKDSKVKVVVCTPFVDLSEVKERIMVDGYPILVGCQDISAFPEGAYTGEEAAAILSDIVEVALIGHSERRANFGETDEVIEDKVQQAVEHKILPLLCVQDQDTLIPKEAKMVAYEPVFAIGSGEADTPANANEVASRIAKIHGGEVSVLYGGSVDEENVKAFLQQDNISGVLVGGASLDGEQFLKIVEVAYNLE